MTITARKATAQIATDSADLLALVINGIFEDLDTCEICEIPADYLYARIDNRDNTEVRVCEHCADNADVSYGDDIDA